MSVSVNRLALFAAAVAVGAGVTVVFFLHGRQAAKTPTVSEADRLVTQVGKLIELPSNEQPIIAAVTDLDKLKGQAFFAKAKNGDQVLIYINNKKAILYDPGEGKIVEVAPVTIGPGGLAGLTAVASTSAGLVSDKGKVKEVVKVAVLNGTGVNGLASAVAEKIATLAGTKVVFKGDAKGNYQKTIIVNLTSGNIETDKTLTDFLGGQIGNLPAGERKTEGADVLIIVGNDYGK